MAAADTVAPDGTIRIDLTIQEVKYVIGDVNYVLREASGLAARKYRQACVTGTEMVIDEAKDTRTVRNLQDSLNVEAFLVSLCLFRVDGNKMSPVSITTIEGWPSRVQKKLFDKAKEISDLTENLTLAQLYKQRDKLLNKIDRMEKENSSNGHVDVDAPEKNSLTATEDGSPSP